MRSLFLVVSWFLLVLGLLTSGKVGAQMPAQGLCGTASPDSSHFAYLEALAQTYQAERDSGIVTRINIPFKAHIVRATGNNNYMQVPALLTTLCELNQKYRSSGIHFYLKDQPNYIYDGNLFYHTGWGQGNTQMTTYNVSRAVNVHYVDLSAMGLCGYATFPGSGAGTTLRQGGLMMSVSCSQPGNTTLAHEMGHYLALPHPFEGTSPQPQGVFAERVTRNPNDTANGRQPSNCANAGDRFCDTPADFIGNRWPCNSAAPQANDINGDPFRPDATLFMSYSYDNCQNRFSNQQIAVMRQTLTGSTGGNGPRSYLLLPPMPAYDTVRTTTTLLEPAVGAAPSPANWVFFRWTSVPNATMYYVRVLRGITLMFERWVNDTSFLYTGPDLGSTGNYSVTVKPLNPASTCAPTSATRSFSTTTPFGASVSGLLESNWRLYPTLLSKNQKLHWQADAPESGLLPQRMTLIIRDYRGKVVNTQTYDTGEGLRELSVDNLEAGVYFFEANGSNHNTRARFILQD
ncbi:MAG: M43 family zinc metalloprotease [Bacteroidota bacterium]